MIQSNSVFSEGILPAPISPQAKYPLSGSITVYPKRLSFARLSCTMGFKNIFVFIAGEIKIGQRHAITVVVSMSSAMPFAILPMTFALAGAMSTMSARFASATCSTLYWKLRSNVSMRHLLPVKVSNVMGLIKFVAFCVISTVISACCFFSILASPAILYAAMLPVTPSKTVLPFSILSSFPFCFYSIIIHFSGFVNFNFKAVPYHVARLLYARKLAVCDHLHDEITDGRALCRARIYR